MIGLVYFSFFLTSLLGDTLLKGLIISNDAVATATRLLANESRFRFCIATGLVETGFYVALTALLFHLFKPVNRIRSLVAAFFRLVGCAIQASDSAFQLFSLLMLRGDGQMPVFSHEQLSNLALLFLKPNDESGELSLCF